MQIEHIIISAGITIFSLCLLIISLASYKKHHRSKLLFISSIFIVLLLKGILLSLNLFFESFSFLNDFLYSPFLGIFDLLILILLFIATLKR